MVLCGCFGPKGAPDIPDEPQEPFSSNVLLEKGASPAPEPAAAAAGPVVPRSAAPESEPATPAPEPATPAPEPATPAPEPVAPLGTPPIASTPPTSPPKVFVQLRPTEDQKPTKVAQPPSQPPFDLHALPITWHKRLSAVLSNSDKLALLQSSKAMCQVVQAVHSVTVRVAVPMAASEASAAETTLLKACQKWSHVTLVCTSTGQPAQAAAATCSLLSGAVTALDHPLSAIKCVDLTGLELDALVPSWLTTACPDMSSLRLSNCQFNLSTTCTAPATACPQLKELHLSDPPTFLEDDEPSPSRSTTSPTHTAIWQRQLCALTGLTSLSVGHFASRFLGCLATVLPSTLERLCFDDNAVPWFLAAWFPSLKELELPSTVVDDRAMKVLVSLKQLQSVACRGFELEADYSERPCAWTRLRLERVSELDVAMLARLPLDNIKSFEIEYEAECTILPSAELDENRRVAAAVAKGDDSGRASKHVAGSVTLQNSSRAADTPCIAAIMPILARCQCESLVISHVTPVTPELLGAMAHYLASAMISRMRFWECTWDEEAIPLLLPSLPRAVSRVHLQRSTSRTMRMQKSMSMALGREFSEAGLMSHKPFLRSQMSERGIKSVTSEIRRMTSEELTESDLAKVCASARRPVELDVYLGKGSGWEEGWEQRVGAAMAAAGHQYVGLPSN